LKSLAKLKIGESLRVIGQDKSIPYPDLIREHEKLVEDLKPAVEEYKEQSKELEEYKDEYKKALKGL
jgi:hypothetical protein